MATIIWDIDDVLNDFTRIWLAQFWKKSNPDCTVNFDELTANPPHTILGITKSTFTASIDKFRCSREFTAIPPPPSIMRWFSEHGHKHKHLALTARPLTAVAPAADWLLTHLGAWFRVFAFVPSRRETDPDFVAELSKAAFIEWLGKGDFFIDDSQENIRKAQSSGVKPLLVKQPWNQGGTERDELLQFLATI